MFNNSLVGRFDKSISLVSARPPKEYLARYWDSSLPFRSSFVITIRTSDLGEISRMDEFVKSLPSVPLQEPSLSRPSQVRG